MNTPYVYPFASQPPPAPPLPPLIKQVKASLSDLQARAKTVRIGKVRWPPPLRESETFENELQRRLELQRKIHEEILTSNDVKSPAVTLNVPTVGKLDMASRQPLFNAPQQPTLITSENKLISNANKIEDEHAIALKKIEDKLKSINEMNSISKEKQSPTHLAAKQSFGNNKPTLISSSSSLTTLSGPTLTTTFNLNTESNQRLKMDKDEIEISSKIEEITGLVNNNSSNGNQCSFQHNRNIPLTPQANDTFNYQALSPKLPTSKPPSDALKNISNKKKFFLLHKLHQNSNNKQAKAVISNSTNPNSITTKNYVNRSTSISGNDLDGVLLNKKKPS